MSDVTLILSQIELGDRVAAEKLLPLVYDELRKMAAARMSAERPDHTLQATALVHDAWLRLVDGPHQHFNSRRHFFSAAAEAMRRILVDHARAKLSAKRGGGQERADFDSDELFAPDHDQQTVDISDALEVLAGLDAESVELLKLRYFAGLSLNEAAEILGMTHYSAEQHWLFAKTWLRKQLR